ncbi:MAG: hypothetical protein ACRBBR_05290 [Cellvibrionaceae bacterium]
MKFSDIHNYKEEINTLHNIKKVADSHSIDICFFGGFAANIYGSERELTDIDILANAESFEWVKDNFSYTDESDKSIHIGRIEICKSPIVFEVAGKKYYWSFDTLAMQKMSTTLIEKEEFKVLSREDLITMKSILGRGEAEGKFDLPDIMNIIQHIGKNNIDFEYVLLRSNKIDSIERVSQTLSGLGFLLESMSDIK